jgi:hypothetical protein
MRGYEPQFERLGALAERYFRDGPNACLTIAFASTVNCWRRK